MPKVPAVLTRCPRPVGGGITGIRSGLQVESVRRQQTVSLKTSGGAQAGGKPLEKRLHRCWTNAEADGVPSLFLKRLIKAFPMLFSLMVSSRDITVSKLSVRGRVKSRPGCRTNRSGISPSFRISECRTSRNIPGVYFMCIFLLKSNFTFQGFAAHFLYLSSLFTLFPDLFHL